MSPRKKTPKSAKPAAAPHPPPHPPAPAAGAPAAAGRIGARPLGQIGYRPLGQIGYRPLGQIGHRPLGQIGHGRLGQIGHGPLGRSAARPLAQPGYRPLGQPGYRPLAIGPGLPQLTGRMLVVMKRGDVKARTHKLRECGKLDMASSSDFQTRPPRVQDLKEGQGIYFEKLAIAIVRQDAEQHRALRAAESDAHEPVEFLEAERYLYPLTEAGLYVRGYRDGVASLAEQLVGAGGVGAGDLCTARERAAAETWEDGPSTWGLLATGVARSKFSGAGIRLAVLDTGLDAGHPDFAERLIEPASFTGEAPDDVLGHGTHCIGTALGPRQSRTGAPRYGIAADAEIYAGKVLNDEGFGDDGGILAGIDWALEHRCHVISMSLGSPVAPGERYSLAYEKAARRAFLQGCLIIAAAGNESNRPEEIAAVGHPANCPSILAVAALDRELAVAYFSCGSVNEEGGGIDIAAPGVDVLSSVPGGGVDFSSGTSMAAPHVAGIAALWAEAVPDVRGRGLGQLLMSNARRLALSSRDAGIGLVQAP